MKITIGSDHAGFALKKVLIEHLRKNGHQLTDVGTDSTAPVDYPDYAEAVARGVADELAKDLCTIFLDARFTGENRHQRRLAKIQAIEQRYSSDSATVDSAFVDSASKEKIS